MDESIDLRFGVLVDDVFEHRLDLCGVRIPPQLRLQPSELISEQVDLVAVENPPTHDKPTYAHTHIHI